MPKRHGADLVLLKSQMGPHRLEPLCSRAAQTHLALGSCAGGAKPETGINSGPSAGLEPFRDHQTEKCGKKYFFKVCKRKQAQSSRPKGLR